VQAAAGDGSRELLEQLRAQQGELQAMRGALDASHAARAAEAEEAARVSVAWSRSVKQVGDRVWLEGVGGVLVCACLACML